MVNVAIAFANLIPTNGPNPRLYSSFRYLCDKLTKCRPSHLADHLSSATDPTATSSISYPGNVFETTAFGDE